MNTLKCNHETLRVNTGDKIRVIFDSESYTLDVSGDVFIGTICTKKRVAGGLIPALGQSINKNRIYATIWIADFDNHSNPLIMIDSVPFVRKNVNFDNFINVPMFTKKNVIVYIYSDEIEKKIYCKNDLYRSSGGRLNFRGKLNVFKLKTLITEKKRKTKTSHVLKEHFIDNRITIVP